MGVSVLRVQDCYVPDLMAEANIPSEHEPSIERFIRFSSQCWVGFKDGHFACMWGLIPPSLLSNNAYLWLVVNELIEENKFVFIRHSQIEVRKMLELYPIITGHCDRRHQRSFRWLQWLGAKFEPGGPISAFTIVRE